MAIFHLHYDFISAKRGDGTYRSLEACFSYRFAEIFIEQVKDLETGIEKSVIHDFTKKLGVVRKGIIVPKDSPNWAYDLQLICKEIKNSEKRKDARWVRDMTIALHKELSLDKNEKLLKAYLQDTFTDNLKVGSLYSIHYDDENNPHAHIVVTTRSLSAAGFSKKKVRILDEKDNSIFLKHIRKNWEIFSNNTFAKKGLNVQITAESYEAQQIGIQATVHEGYKSKIHEQLHGESDLIEYNKRVMFDNLMKFKETPDNFRGCTI